MKWSEMIWMMWNEKERLPMENLFPPKKSPPPSNCLTYIPNDMLTKQEKDTPASP